MPPRYKLRSSNFIPIKGVLNYMNRNECDYLKPIPKIPRGSRMLELCIDASLTYIPTPQDDLIALATSGFLMLYDLTIILPLIFGAYKGLEHLIKKLGNSLVLRNLENRNL
jgi:hypothetical protein